MALIASWTRWEHVKIQKRFLSNRTHFCRGWNGSWAGLETDQDWVNQGDPLDPAPEPFLGRNGTIEPNEALIGSKKPVTHFHIYRALAAASNVGPSCLSSWNYLQVLSGLWHMHRLFHPFECRDCNWQVVWGLHKSWTNACKFGLSGFNSAVWFWAHSLLHSVHVCSKLERLLCNL